MKKIVKFRHRFFNKLASPFVTKFIRKKFNYTYESCDIKPPFLVLANHTVDWDPFFISKSFKSPIYYVMSDHVSSLKAGKLIKFLVSPIPITKSSIDAGTVRDIINVIQHNAAVGIFPEGNKSFGGDMSFIKPSISKLIKKLGVPVLIYNIEGGYFSSPRWSKIKRTGHVHGFVKRLITVEEIDSMDHEELYQLMIDNLKVNAYEVQEKNKVKFNCPENRAVGIESFLYTCPKCKQISSLYGENNDILCHKCDFKATLDEYGYLSGGEFKRLDKFDEWQKENLQKIDFSKYSEEDVITQDNGWEVQKKVNKFKSQPLGVFSTLLKKSALYLQNEETTIKIDINDIAGQAIEGACGIQLWLKNGDVYRIKNSSNNISGLKYVNFIWKLRGEEFRF